MASVQAGCRTWPFWLLPAVVWLVGGNGRADSLAVSASDTCQPIEIEMCRDLPYNFTSMPNLAGNEDQSEAEIQLLTFQPLVQTQCSAQLKFFLCSVYVPMCTDKVDVAIGPCRPLCDSVRLCCEPMLRQFGFPWPALLNCSKFPPENNAQAMCMKGPGGSDHVGGTCSNLLPSVDDSPVRHPHQLTPGQPDIIDDLRRFPPARRPDVFQRVGVGGGGVGGVGVGVGVGGGLDSVGAAVSAGTTGISGNKNCNNLPSRTHPDVLSNYVLINKTGGCVPLCDNASGLFLPQQRTFAVGVLNATYILCLLLCLTAVALQLACGGREQFELKCAYDRLRYVETPVLFICICYAMASAASLVPLFTPSLDADGWVSGVSCVEYRVAEHSKPVLVGQGLQPVTCALVAVVLYYFFAVSRLWWLILCGVWLLCGPLAWSAETVERRAFWLHIVAWGLPVLKVVLVLVRQSVDGDPLTGVCYVGNQNVDDLMSLLILPELLCLVVGLLPLLVGAALALNLRFGGGGLGVGGRVMDNDDDDAKRLAITGCKYRPTPSGRPLVNGGGGGSLVSEPAVWPSAECLAARGFLAAFFLVPSLCLLAAYAYEYTRRHRWLTLDERHPSFETFLVKIVARAAYGLACALWIICRRLWHRRLSWPGRKHQQQHQQQSHQPSATVVGHGASLSLLTCKSSKPDAGRRQPTLSSHQRQPAVADRQHPPLLSVQPGQSVLYREANDDNSSGSWLRSMGFQHRQPPPQRWYSPRPTNVIL